MKLTKILLIATVAGAIAFAASKASAFPLYLKSLSGTVTVTTNYSTIESNNVPIVDSAKYTVDRFSLKDLYTFITNRVYLNTGTNVPPKTQIAWDPYVSSYPYLTNSSTGYYQSLSSMMYMEIEDIATSFKGGNGSGGSESDVITDYLDLYGDDLSGLYFEIYQDDGTGTLTYSVNKAGIGKMTIKTKGGEYGAYLDSDDGVSYCTAVWSGSGTPQWSGPFSTWWY